MEREKRSEEEEWQKKARKTKCAGVRGNALHVSGLNKTQPSLCAIWLPPYAAPYYGCTVKQLVWMYESGMALQIKLLSLMNQLKKLKDPFPIVTHFQNV